MQEFEGGALNVSPRSSPALSRIRSLADCDAREGKSMRKKNWTLALGLPEDAAVDCARVTLSGQSAALVEGQHGVVELSGNTVRLRTGRGVLTIRGEELTLKELSMDAALITGKRVTTATYAQRGEDGKP